MTVLAIIDIALSLVAAGLWGGYWWMIRAFPEVPLLQRWPISPSYRTQTVQQAPYFTLYATATAPGMLGVPDHVHNGIYYQGGVYREHWTREDDL